MEYKETDFISRDEGIQYVFRKFSIIYGSRFASHWENMSMAAVMATWMDMIGNYLTYRPTLDFALNNLDSKGFVTTPMAFKELCSQAGRIPVKPERTITYQKTQAEIARDLENKEIAMQKLAAFMKRVGAK